MQSVIDNYLGFDINYEQRKIGKDVKSAHIFKATKPFFLAISIIFYEVSSTKPDITFEEIKRKGLDKIKIMIDRESKYFEENL